MDLEPVIAQPATDRDLQDLAPAWALAHWPVAPTGSRYYLTNSCQADTLSGVVSGFAKLIRSRAWVAKVVEEPRSEEEGSTTDEKDDEEVARDRPSEGAEHSDDESPKGKGKLAPGDRRKGRR